MWSKGSVLRSVRDLERERGGVEIKAEAVRRTEM